MPAFRGELKPLAGETIMQTETAALPETEDDLNQSQQEAEQSEKVAEEFEIGIGDSPSQSARKGSPMVRRIIGERDKAREQSKEKDAEIARLRSELEGRNTGANESPNFDDYSNDDDYKKAVVDWAQSQRKPVPDPLDLFNRYQEQTKADQAIDQHYERATELAKKFPGYSDAESNAKEVLGDGLVTEIARLSGRSAEVLLYLGLNPEEAQRFKSLSDSNPTQAAIELGRLEAKVSIQPKTKSKLPEPDEPLEGGSSVNTKMSGLQKKLDAARKAGDMEEAVRIRRAMKGEG